MRRKAGAKAVAPAVRELLDFTGRVTLVTGAGSGFGRVIARRFAEAGARVAVHYRGSRDGAEAVVREIAAAGGEARSFAADLTVEGEPERLVDEVAAAFGPLGALVNNAGGYPLADLLQMKAADWDTVLAQNLRTALACLQAAGRRMAARGEGAIVNVTSIQAFRPAPALAHYSAAKAGLEMLTRSAALELGPSGVRVNAVAPGLVRREGLERAWPEGVARYVAAAPLGRIAEPEDVADACLFLASPAARFVTGTTLVVDGGVLAAPAF
jgi:NAD(P)-dependent dehydrogenase (short-subunit alcohol dehydrogenase family)